MICFSFCVFFLPLLKLAFNTANEEGKTSSGTKTNPPNQRRFESNLSPNL